MDLSKTNIRDLQEMFGSLILTMDIPLERRQDWNWLGRNLQIRNSEHMHFQQSREILMEILKR